MSKKKKSASPKTHKNKYENQIGKVKDGSKKKRKRNT